MADQPEVFIPATLVGIVVTYQAHEGDDTTWTDYPRVRLHLEAKKSDWSDIEALEGLPGIKVLPDGQGVILEPTYALILLKGAEPEPPSEPEPEPKA